MPECDTAANCKSTTVSVSVVSEKRVKAAPRKTRSAGSDLSMPTLLVQDAPSFPKLQRRSDVIQNDYSADNVSIYEEIADDDVFADGVTYLDLEYTQVVGVAPQIPTSKVPAASSAPPKAQKQLSSNDFESLYRFLRQRPWWRSRQCRIVAAGICCIAIVVVVVTTSLIFSLSKDDHVSASTSSESSTALAEKTTTEASYASSQPGTADPGPNWRILKRYTMGDMNAVRTDWAIERHPPGFVSNQCQEYVDSEETIFTRNGHLVIKAFRRNGKYFSGQLRSKATFSPADYVGKKLKVEFKAKVPTVSGAWPALWMFGLLDQYGDRPRNGQIDVMQWVHQIGDSNKASLHWKSKDDLSTDFNISRAEMSNNFNTYGVDYSNHIYNEYVQFYIIKPSDGTLWGPWLEKDAWIWDDFPPCNYTYTAEASHCSYLAPFDNRMALLLNIAIGGDWGNCCGVQPSDCSVFESGVEMEVSDVAVYFASHH